MSKSRHRILFFSATSSPIGGVETWLDRACRYLGERGFDPVVGLVRGLRFNVPERFREFHPNLETFDVDGRGLDREGRIRAVMRCLRRVRPDIVLPLGVLDANAAVLRCKAAGAPLRLVGRAQGNLPPMLADLEDYRDGFDMVVCPGRLTARYLTQCAEFSPVRVRHVSNGADLPTTPRTERASHAPLRLGYVGRFTQQDKRILDLPELCRCLAERGLDYRLEIAGDGPSRDELLGRLGPYQRRITYHGALAHEDVYTRILPNLDVLLLFSSSEAFGIVLAEAMMNGVVPVTSRYVGFRSERLVVDGEHGLSFPIGDMSAAADAVARLAESADLLPRLSQAARDHATCRYTWKQCLSGWQRCLEELLTLPPVAGHLPVHAAAASSTGRLNRIGMPPAAVDVVRRVRRRVLGPSVPPGGEEWPLFHRHHSEERLRHIDNACRSIEQAASQQHDRAPCPQPATVC
jgi:glycosyltransferase involved in cell wall biosynthesis